METTSVENITLYFDAREQEAAELIRRACEKTVQLMREHWGLDTPPDLRVYVMTSWLRSTFRAAPWPQKLKLGLLFPLWAVRARQMWPYAGGWERSYGERQTVCIKPPRLIPLGDNSIGDQIFVQENDAREKVRHITCHELVHAFTSHLQLPAWLKEGLAMVTVDRFFARPTVRQETLDVLERWSRKTGSKGDQRLNIQDRDATVYLYARGYWLTRYIEDTRPGLLNDLFSRRHLEDKLASAYDKPAGEFWKEIDGIAVAHFKWGGKIK